jgi:hypothetical protein
LLDPDRQIAGGGTVQMDRAGAAERHTAAELPAVVPSTSRSTHRKVVCRSTSAVRSTALTSLVVGTAISRLFAQIAHVLRLGAVRRSWLDNACISAYARF